MRQLISDLKHPKFPDEFHFLVQCASSSVCRLSATNCWMTQPMQKIVARWYAHVTVVPSVEPVPGGGNWRIVLTHSHSLSLSSTPDHHVTDFSSSYFILYLLLYAYLHAAVGCAATVRTHTALALLTKIPFIPLFIQSQECQVFLKKEKLHGKFESANIQLDLNKVGLNMRYTFFISVYT